MAYYTWDYQISGFCPLSSILKVCLFLQNTRWWISPGTQGSQEQHSEEFFLNITAQVLTDCDAITKELWQL
jgi:hypothetical protein